MTVAAGFVEYGREAQFVFKRCLDALARPGKIRSFETELTPPVPLLPTAAAVALTLVDFEVTLWADEKLSSSSDALSFLSFHTGAQFVDHPAHADFAIISDPARMPALRQFKQGTAEFPDRSTTLIIQVEQMNSEEWCFSGPGIREQTAFGASALPQDFGAQCVENRSRFPLGVDMIFTAETSIAALPRSVVLDAKT